MSQPATTPGSDQAKATSIRSHRFLPRIGSPGYHILLGAVAILILGPLGGISAAYMNFSIGFFIGGQVLAGILGRPSRCRTVRVESMAPTTFKPWLPP